MRRLLVLIAVLVATQAQMQKSREVKSHEAYHAARRDKLARKSQAKKTVLRKGGSPSKTLHELRMKKQVNKNAKKKKRRPGL